MDIWKYLAIGLVLLIVVGGIVWRNRRKNKGRFDDVPTYKTALPPSTLKKGESSRANTSSAGNRALRSEAHHDD